MHKTANGIRRFGGVQRLLGYLLVSVGALLLLASGAYYGYSYWSKSTLDDLTFESARPVTSANVTRDVAGPSEAALPVPASASVSPDASAAGLPAITLGAAKETAPSSDDRRALKPASGATAAATTEANDASSPSGPATHSAQTQVAGAASEGDAEPGVVTQPAAASVESGSAAEPAPSEPAAASEPAPEAEQQQEAVSASTQASDPDVTDGLETSPIKNEGVALAHMALALPDSELLTFAAPTPELLSAAAPSPSRIVIPSIGVDSDVSQLRLLSKNTGYEWETPKWVVGHVPTSGNPGMQRQGWYFGHLESPLRREGNVFKRLPDIPPLLKDGETVHIVVEADDRKYLYQVYKSDWVHKDDLKITYSREQDITLVTCYPTLVYDHRLLVTAALVGVSES